MTKKRNLATVVLVVLLTILLTACGGKGIEGKWRSNEGDSTAEFRNGVLYSNGEEVGTYKVIGDEHIELTSDGDTWTVRFNLDKDYLTTYNDDGSYTYTYTRID